MSLPEAAARFIIDDAPIAHLVTLGPDGTPHLSMAWADVDDGDVVIGTLFDQRKLRNIRNDPRVAISFEGTTTRPPGLREYLAVHGTATVTEGGAPELLAKLGERYLGPGTVFPPMPNPPAGFLTRVHVDHVTGVGPWTD